MRQIQALEEKKDIISRKDFVKVVAIVLSNWHVLTLIPIVAFAISYVYTHRIPDVYAARCQILLKSNETYNYQQQIYKGLGFSSKYASYEETASQMRVIKSSNLIEDVLERLPLNISYFIVGRLKVTEVYQHLPFKVESDERSAVQSDMRFYLNIIDEEHFKLSYEVNGINHLAEYKFGHLILDDGLYLRVHKQRNLNKVSIKTLSQINYMFRVHKEASLIAKYKSSIEVKNIDYTSIVEITLKDEIADRAQEVLDTLARIYVLNTVQSQSDINENTLGYIDRQLDEVTGIINVIESEIEAYREQNAILNLDKEEETFYGRMVDLENQDRILQFELKEIDDLTSYLLKNEDVESLLPPSIFVNDSDPKLREQVQELYVLRAEYNSLLTSGTASNPKIALISDRIGSLKRDILSYLDVRKTAVESKREELGKDIQTYASKIKNIPKTLRQLLNIERRLSVNEELYSFLLSKRAETVIARAGLVPETRIIENARSIGVVYPDKTQMNLMNVLIGFGLSVVIVLLRVLFFQKITSVGQLQSATNLSILGSIPHKKNFSKTYRIVSGSERSDISQAFRSLRTNLQFFAPNSKHNRILVTSLMPGEGKTFTSVNLASILAIADKRVLIVDFDMHKPRLAKAMGLENTKGVSNILIGDATVEEVLQNSDIEHLDVITSGPVPPNASELIMRNELQLIFDFAEKNYDFVFLDTPPISLITDGILLMNRVDVKLFVLNSKFTSNTSIDFIERLIASNKLTNCALVLNEERVTALNYYYSRYGYGGYGYAGYGYGGYGYGDYYGTDSSKRE